MALRAAVNIAPMISFRRLAVASTAATLLLVAVGGLVRATKSGLGCGTDWPHCGGRVIPIFGSQAVVIEYSHRLVAAAVILLIGALAVVAVRSHRAEPRIVWPAVGAFGLVLGQAILGAIVVKLELDAVSVVLHLATAMALVGLLVSLTIKAYALDGRLESSPHGPTALRAGIAAGSVLALLMVGSYVSGRHAGYAFSDWPLMNGSLVPDLGIPLYAVHFVHRLLAAVVAVVVALIALPIARDRSRQQSSGLARAVLGLFGFEILLGAANVWTKLNAGVVTLHLLTGGLIWACLVGIGQLARPLPAASESRVEREMAADRAVEMAAH